MVINTGGPRYSRFLSKLFLHVQENIPNPCVRGSSRAYLKFFDEIRHAIKLKVVFLAIQHS